MITLPISTLFVTGMGILFLILSIQVMRRRTVAKVSLGDGGDEGLIRSSRGQGNLVEYAPFMMSLVVVAELQGGYPWVIGAAAAAFFIGRLGHGYALSFTDKSVLGRGGGIVLTFVGMVVMIVHNLAMFVL